MTEYERYQEEVGNDVRSLIADLNCQPILLIGSGLCRRYFSGPSWDELLEYLVSKCPQCDKSYAYYKQKYKSPLTTGTTLADLFFEWAWGTGNNSFPKELFENGNVDTFIKYFIATHLNSITPKSADGVADKWKPEIQALQQIRPHALITTNYDQFIERIFPDYTAIIGQEILGSHTYSVGEVLKIHGCVSRPKTMVFTEEDYDIFLRKKKYLSAKLLTYFSEHPVLIAGYSAEDKNIRSILSDIDEALPLSGDTIRNIYFLEWDNKLSPDSRPPKEKLLAIEDAKSVRVRCIVANDFEWAYEAFRSPEALNGISPKILRALMARSYELVRQDIPRRTVEANFEMLEGAVESSDEFAKLIGITTIKDPSHIAAAYPYSLTAVAAKLGFSYWYGAHKLIEQIAADKSIDIKSSDNKYHFTVKLGKSKFHKYSDAMISLLKLAKNGEPYEVEL